MRCYKYERGGALFLSFFISFFRSVFASFLPYFFIWFFLCFFLFSFGSFVRLLFLSVFILYFFLFFSLSLFLSIFLSVFRSFFLSLKPNSLCFVLSLFLSFLHFPLSFCLCFFLSTFFLFFVCLFLSFVRGAKNQKPLKARTCRKSARGEPNQGRAKPLKNKTMARCEDVEHNFQPTRRQNWSKVLHLAAHACTGLRCESDGEQRSRQVRPRKPSTSFEPNCERFTWHGAMRDRKHILFASVPAHSLGKNASFHHLVTRDSRDKHFKLCRRRAVCDRRGQLMDSLASSGRCFQINGFLSRAEKNWFPLYVPKKKTGFHCIGLNQFSITSLYTAFTLNNKILEYINIYIYIHIKLSLCGPIPFAFPFGSPFLGN